MSLIADLGGYENNLRNLKQTEIDQLKAKLALCCNENKGLIESLNREKTRTVEVMKKIAHAKTGYYGFTSEGGDIDLFVDDVEKALRGQNEK